MYILYDIDVAIFRDSSDIVSISNRNRKSDIESSLSQTSRCT